MLKKKEYGNVRAIFCHDLYDFDIRCLKRALDILAAEQDADDYCDRHGEGEEVYPLDIAIELIKERIWKEYDAMTSQKATYTNDEWLRLKDAHNARGNGSPAVVSNGGGEKTEK